MNISFKKLFLIFAVLIPCGGLIFVGAMCALDWNFGKLSAKHTVENEHMLTENFDEIEIVTDDADIELVITEEGESRAVCREHSHAKHSVAVENGRLTVRVQNERKWYHYILDGTEKSITLYLTRAQYSALSVKGKAADVTLPEGLTLGRLDVEVTSADVSLKSRVDQTAQIAVSTGNITVESSSLGALSATATTGDITVDGVRVAGNLTVSVSTGDTVIKNVECKELVSEGGTGDLHTDALRAQKLCAKRTTGTLTLEDTIATEMHLDASTGDVTLTLCDGDEIYITTTTGNVTGTLLTDKVFIARANTGRVETPRTITGGRCEITTGTGDIIFTEAQN